MRDPRRSRKRDVVLLRSRVSRAAPRYQQFDVGFGDSATDAVVVDGRVWLSGITNDEAGAGENEMGLVARVDREGDLGPVLRLAGPRDVQVDVIASDGAGGLLIGGIENVRNLDGCSLDALRCEARSFTAKLPAFEPTVRTRAEYSTLPSVTWPTPEGALAPR